MDKLNAYQQQKSKAERLITIGGIAIVVAVFTYLLVMQSFKLYIALPLGFVGIILLIIGSVIFSDVSKRFKSEVMTELIKDELDEGYFSAGKGLSAYDVYSCEFMKRADRFHSEDYISGKIDGVKFESSDVKLEERHVRHTKNGTRTYYETYYQGRLFIFDFNKRFDGFVQVLERGRPQSNRDFNRVQLESVAFNDTFTTYTTNDHTAFYVLTPHFMEALMDFEQHNRGNIGFSFIENKLYIGINNRRDTFELQLYRPINTSLIEEFRRDLLVVKDVVHELRLNNKIFKK
ncbi:MAG: DUF3137 domain-containing protein [Candidatus Izemoplasma sp.]|nr:DUF3137 domain-containing protein [Candidatus Izemoplasma sp.]